LIFGGGAEAFRLRSAMVQAFLSWPLSKAPRATAAAARDKRNELRPQRDRFHFARAAFLLTSARNALYLKYSPVTPNPEEP